MGQLYIHDIGMNGLRVLVYYEGPARKHSYKSSACFMSSSPPDYGGGGGAGGWGSRCHVMIESIWDRIIINFT